jgi:hypothetical protein
VGELQTSSLDDGGKRTLKLKSFVPEHYSDIAAQGAKNKPMSCLLRSLLA